MYCLLSNQRCIRQDKIRYNLEMKNYDPAPKEVSDDGTASLAKHIARGKSEAAQWPPRPDQEDQIDTLKKRLEDDLELCDHSLFDIVDDDAMVRISYLLLKLSGKKKSNKMANLQVMYPKYKRQLEEDEDMQRIYQLLSDAGIWKAFMNFYGLDGLFDFHRDRFLTATSNCMPKEDAEKVKTRRYCHKVSGLQV
jgi:hypothetical protein